ncbi:hypothetical protein NHQ30_003809 [Ciborinia camelliae]|nr:hypothetical protein NHQ30_003809 [Ciborinia camelliae]
MRLEDGTLDTNLRTSAIAHLLNNPNLTFGELRMFKAHFDDIDFRRDPISKFPVELVVKVVEYLDLEDFMTMPYFERPKPQFNVWSLDTEADPVVIHLEGFNAIFSSHNKQIAFGNKDIHVWINGHTKTLAEPKFDAPDVPNDTLELHLCGFIFHPTEKNHYFVFYQPIYQGHPKIKRIIIQEHISGRPHKTWHQDLLSSDFSFLTATLIDDYGLVALKSTESTRPCSIQTPSPCNHGISQHTFTTFNIITKEFGMLANHSWSFPMAPTSPWPYLVWRGQSIELHSERAESYKEYNLPSIAISGKPSFALVSASTCDPSTTRRTLGCVGGAYLSNIKHRAAAAFCLPFGDEVEVEVPNRRRSEGVWGDDDFIVWSDQNGYIVWNFDPAVTLPTINVIKARSWDGISQQF